MSVRTGNYVTHLPFYKEINLPTKLINNQLSTKLILPLFESDHTTPIVNNEYHVFVLSTALTD